MIDPIPVDGTSAGETMPVTVRLAESDYPVKLLSDIRLYHNEKLVPDGRFAKAEGLGRFTVRLVPGRNDFRRSGSGTAASRGRRRRCVPWPFGAAIESGSAPGLHRHQRLSPSVVGAVLCAQ